MSGLRHEIHHEGCTCSCSPVPLDPMQARFWGRMRVADSGCWEWTGAISAGTGYGTVSYQGEKWSTHRLAWTLAKGQIHGRLFVLHVCDNRPCCNPSHLWLGTPLDNMRDKEAKGRGFSPYQGKTHCKRGHPFEGENLRLRPDGTRRCAECYRMYRRQYTERLAAANASSSTVCGCDDPETAA